MPERASQPVHAVTFDMDLKVPMRDGVLLSADLYRPSGVARGPVVLFRTPYDNGNPRYVEQALWYARRGYTFVSVDCRGRYDSDGKWYAWHNEADDGFDTQEWAGSQPWCDGNIGTTGGSYGGLTQWLPAPRRSRYLKAMVPWVTPSDFWFQDNYVGGAFQLCLNMWWAVQNSGRVAQNLSIYDLPSMYRTLPLIQADRFTGRVIDFYRDWLLHEAYDDYWRAISNHERYRDIDVPIYNIGGLYDAYAGAAAINFRNMRTQGRTEQTRARQKLLIGPWTHSPLGGSRAGEMDFGASAVVERAAEELRWFDCFLKGLDTGVVDEPPVRIFVTGSNEWIMGGEWPLGGTRSTPLFLHSAGRASTLLGDGRLDWEPPRAEPPDRFRYDPAHPAPTVGGNHSSPPEFLPAGVFDQRGVEMRADVLVYTSEVLSRPLRVVGPVEVRLWVASSAPDTDVTARLVDVGPDGYAMNLCEGILRLRYRDSWERPTLMAPGDVYPIVVDLGITSHTFLPGRRLRLDISSSSFPRFDRNLNTGEPIAHATRMQIADQTLFHSEDCPSHLQLSVLASPPQIS
jgi:putative CocE/NonD family hydrolase